MPWFFCKVADVLCEILGDVSGNSKPTVSIFN
jgi:hypothetical protein